MEALKVNACADVNDRVNTRKKLKKHDPQLAALLELAFGDGEWRYQQTSPIPLSHQTPTRFAICCQPYECTHLNLLSWALSSEAWLSVAGDAQAVCLGI